ESRHAAPVPRGERRVRHHREPDHRGRQPRGAEAPAEVVSGQGQDDLHRPALQHRERLHLSRQLHRELQTYLEYTGQVDAEGRKFGTNTDTDGRFHSKWLNMMYPRLYLARNLLREDGVIFVSINDGEVANLRSILDAVFGEESFVGTAVWQKAYTANMTAQ